MPIEHRERQQGRQRRARQKGRTEEATAESDDAERARAEITNERRERVTDGLCQKLTKMAAD